MAIIIKGYVKFFDKKVPVTWKRETEKFVYDVRRIRIENNKMVVNRRLFDDKMPKKEVYSPSAAFDVLERVSKNS